MADNRSSENGLNWADGHIEYNDLHTVFTEAVAGFTQLYAYGVFKITFPSILTGRTFDNLEDVIAPPQIFSISNTGVPCRVTNSPNLLAQPKRCIPSMIG